MGVARMKAREDDMLSVVTNNQEKWRRVDEMVKH
jgi:hypothetical protein